jgi:hypothetical protein
VSDDFSERLGIWMGGVVDSAETPGITPITTNPRLDLTGFTTSIQHSMAEHVPVFVTPNHEVLTISAPLFDASSLTVRESNLLSDYALRLNAEIVPAQVIKVDNVVALARHEYLVDVDDVADLSQRIKSFTVCHETALVRFDHWRQSLGEAPIPPVMLTQASTSETIDLEIPMERIAREWLL